MRASITTWSTPGAYFFILFTLIISTVILAVVFCACSGSSSPKAVVNDYYKALKSGDFEKAMTYTDLPEEARPVVIEYLDSIGMVIHTFEVTGSTLGEGDTTAFVNLHLVTSNAFFPDSIADDIIVPCIKNGRNWKVHLNE